ncbi:uncharacterized protein TNCV_1305851 [Trichonephila clavipes]|nr:uncharacterized protein TNCV_1305851 [Trichonephila clavipes]
MHRHTCYYRNRYYVIAPVRAVGSLVLRASDSRPEGLSSMPDATKYPPSTRGFQAVIVEVEIGGDDIHRPFGEFRRAKIVLSPVWCSRPTTGVLLAPCHDEFRGPRSDYVRQMALETATTMPLRHGGTLNSRRAASPLVWLVEGKERWEASDHPQSVLPLKPNSTATCMVLKATANDRRNLALFHDELGLR